MGIFDRLFGANEPEDKKTVCGVCNKEMNWKDGYVLSTCQVLTTEAYWEFAFTHQWSYTRTTDQNGDSVAILVSMQARAMSWLVCETCSNLFSFNRRIAKDYAKRQSLFPPDLDTGNQNLGLAALAAAKAWKKLYGKWPSSIQLR